MARSSQKSGSPSAILKANRSRARRTGLKTRRSDTFSVFERARWLASTYRMLPNSNIHCQARGDLFRLWQGWPSGRPRSVLDYCASKPSPWVGRVSRTIGIVDLDAGLFIPDLLIETGGPNDRVSGWVFFFLGRLVTLPICWPAGHLARCLLFRTPTAASTRGILLLSKLLPK
jgi:hypothetical protein